MKGTITLKPLKGSACQTARRTEQGKVVTYISCQDTGLFQGVPRRNSGSGYSWRWAMRKGESTKEVGLLSINFGTASLLLRLGGTLQTVGTATTAHGRAHTTGTFQTKSATGGYQGKVASGSYTLTVERSATTYRVLNLQLRGKIH